MLLRLAHANIEPLVALVGVGFSRTAALFHTGILPYLRFNAHTKNI